MERLTEDRGERTYQWYRRTWYVNFSVSVVLVLIAGYVWASEATGASSMTDALIIFAVAAVMFIGSSITRYQSRLEGQHLELKLTLNKVLRELESQRKN